MEKETVLEFKNFGFKYNAQSEPTLYDISFSLHRGEKVLIVGPSGCGKSTLVHCINGLIPFSYKGEMTGSIEIAGQKTHLASIFDISHHVGTVLQDSDAQFVGLTVAEDIAFALENDCVAQPELISRVAETAQLVNVSELLQHAPGELSGGQKQRVSMAGVLVDDVEILLFDEPLANLDPATGKTAIELIDDMQKQSGAAVIIVEHRLEDVLHRHVDRILLMDKGRIVADMTPEALLKTTLLSECGIREPLYLTALKYAKADIPALEGIDSICTLECGAKTAEKVRTWMEKNPSAAVPNLHENLLEVKDLEFTYPTGHKAIDHVSLAVKEGEMLAVVGTNGAGKTTFSKLICGFENADSGSILFEGTDLGPLSIKERADHIGYVMQNPNQMISKTMIFDEVALGLKVRGFSEEEIQERVEKALKICGLYPFRKWPVSALSFGQKKRVTIASILTLDPKMIILDEPTAGQDYRHYTEIMEFLTELNKSGITILMITHDMHLMLEYATRAVVFSDGRIIADATPAEILTNEDVISRASLKETSLYALALKCGVKKPSDFVQCFIDYERENCR